MTNQNQLHNVYLMNLLATPMNKNVAKNRYFIITFSFVLYIACVYIYTSFTLDQKRDDVISAIDERLKVGSYSVFDILGEDFFRRAINHNSITPEEDLKNIEKLTSFNKHAGLAFVYSLTRKDGDIYVTSSSATQEELNSNTELHYFHPYDTASNVINSVFEDHVIKTVEYNDEWGRFRGMFIPIRIGNNHTAVLASEVELSYLYQVLNNVKYKSYTEGFMFLLFLVPFIFSIRYILKQENIELHKSLRTDNLTNLPNNLYLFEHLDDLFSKPIHHQIKLALLHIDIDNFKEINDGFGSLIGDIALRSIANRLNNSIKKRGILTRYGGDEFFAAIPYNKQTDTISEITKELFDLFAPPITAGEYNFYISFSVGISLFPTHAKTTNELIQCAHMATYSAKEHGKKRYQVFNSEINNVYDKRCELRQHINRAINNNEYHLVYQPQYNAVTNRVVGVEALLRWEHPTKGLISPNDFIPYAEDSGLIIEIGKIVLEQAISKVSEWKIAGVIHDIRVAINISPQLLYQDRFISMVNDILTEYNCSPDVLKFEITEQVIIKNRSATIAKLQKIRNMGVEISIDDFGSGYSSLAYIKDLPVDQLKIDRSFIVNIPKEGRNRTIVESIIHLCRGLNLSIIAEGAETKEEVDYLVGVGCECIQGFYFSKPLEQEKFFDLMGSTANIY